MIQHSITVLLTSVILFGCAHSAKPVEFSNPTPELFRAASRGDIAELSKANNYQVNGTSSLGTTLLMVAARRNQPESVAYLISRNANASAIDMHKQTVLHYALPPRNRQVITALLKAGADPTIEDFFGVVPLISWAEDGMYDVMLTALENKDRWCCYAQIKDELHKILNAALKEKKYIPPTLFLVLKDLE